jgi:hypothetical protein
MMISPDRYLPDNTIEKGMDGVNTHPSPPIHRSSLNTLNLSSPSASLTLSLIAAVIFSASFKLD